MQCHCGHRFEGRCIHTLPKIDEYSPGEQAAMIKEIEWGVPSRTLAVAR